MSNKGFGWLITFVICVAVGIWGFCKTLHCNDVQNLMIVQNIDGTVEIRREGGWFPRICPRIWKYPKASVEICNEGDRDAIKMQFSNKTTASLACQIGYRIDSTNDEQVLALHQLVEGSDDKIWKIVQTSLQTAVQRIASQYTPSESVEKFDEFQGKISKAILHDKELLEKGIDVVSFTCAGLPKYDNETIAQFNKQKEADLAKRLAQAEKDKLEAEKIKVEANYQKEIAEYKGKADAETAKLKTEAERQKTLAEIEAQKKVAVQELEKQEMLIKAQKEKEVATIEIQKQKEVAKIEAEKLREVAEIAKQTEAANLEKIQLIAKQKVASAEAKKKEIELSGAITEQEQFKLTIQKDIEIGKAEAYAKGIAGAKLPQMWVTGGTTADGKTAQNPFEMLLQTMTLEKLNNVKTVTK